MPIPDTFRVLFWDIDFDALDSERDRDTIVARIAEHGTDEAVRWLRKTYTDAQIGTALEARRSNLSRRTVNLWALWLGKPEDLVRGDPLTPAQRRFLETLKGSPSREPPVEETSYGRLSARAPASYEEGTTDVIAPAADRGRSWRQARPEAGRETSLYRPPAMARPDPSTLRSH